MSKKEEIGLLNKAISLINELTGVLSELDMDTYLGDQYDEVSSRLDFLEGDTNE